MVIAATHMGHYTDGNRGVNAPGDVEMARTTQGLDLIVGGHDHVLIQCFAHGTPIFIDGWCGKLLITVLITSWVVSWIVIDYTQPWNEQVIGSGRIEGQP